MKNEIKIRKNHIVEAITHCIGCRGIVIKDIEAFGLEGEISFLIRCPHCSRNCKVKISAHKEVKTTLE